MIIYLLTLALIIIASLYVLLRPRPLRKADKKQNTPHQDDSVVIPKQAVNLIKDQFKIDVHQEENPVQFLFVRTTGIAEARITLVISNQSPCAVTIKKIVWELWLGQLVKSAALVNSVEIPENTSGFNLQLVELLNDREADIASRGSARGDLNCYLEGVCYCRTAAGNFEKKFALLNLDYEILGDAKFRQVGSGSETKIDSFTGFMSRSYIEDNMQSIIDRTAGRHPISLIMIDLDHFKTINDTYGHLAGDEAIKIVCQQIKDVIADRGISVRYGGDEFSIILEYCESQDAEFFAQRILEGVRQCHFSVGDHEWNVTLSIGVATLHQLADYKVLIKKADDMLLRSKQEGRDRITIDRADRRTEGRDRRRN